VWAVLDPSVSIDVAAHLGPVDEQLGAVGLDQLQYVNALPFAANWKCVAEELLESLHVPFVHLATFNVDPGTQGEWFQTSKAIELSHP
jgi:phenylpropionate dioxygenase-like ring-hydroxylating dioxygenase large terminal subunit